jgi:hypothetical protein
MRLDEFLEGTGTILASSNPKRSAAIPPTLQFVEEETQ